MAYTVKADVKEYLGIAAGNTGDDDLIDDLIDRAQAIIDAYCHRTFEASVDATRKFDAIADVDMNGRRLWLDEDLCAITTITNGDAVAVTATEYVTEPRNRTPWYALTIRADANIVWTYGDYPEDAISIEGKWAWSTSAPNDIVKACLIIAEWLFRQKDTSADIDRALIADGIVVLPQSMPQIAQQILRPYIKRTRIV